MERREGTLVVRFYPLLTLIFLSPSFLFGDPLSALRSVFEAVDMFFFGRFVKGGRFWG